MCLILAFSVSSTPLRPCNGSENLSLNYQNCKQEIEYFHSKKFDTFGKHTAVKFYLVHKLGVVIISETMIHNYRILIKL